MTTIVHHSTVDIQTVSWPDMVITAHIVDVWVDSAALIMGGVTYNLTHEQYYKLIDAALEAKTAVDANANP